MMYGGQLGDLMGSERGPSDPCAQYTGIALVTKEATSELKTDNYTYQDLIIVRI